MEPKLIESCQAHLQILLRRASTCTTTETPTTTTPMVLNPLSWFTSSSPATAPPPITSSPLPLETQLPSNPTSPSSTTSSSTPTPTPTTTAAAVAPLNDTQRFHRQLTMLVAGSAFLALSIRATRKVSLRKQKAMYPTFYHPNNQPLPGASGNAALEAIEALNLASLNVVSFAMMLVGGGMVAMDVTNLDELRGRVRGWAGETEQSGEERRREEEEWEEWMVGVLARGELKEKAKRMAEEEFARERARK